MKTIFQQLNARKRCSRRKRLSVSELLLTATQLATVRGMSVIDVFLTSQDRHKVIKSISAKARRESRGRLRPCFSWDKSELGFDYFSWKMQSLVVNFISSRNFSTPGLIDMSDTPSLYHGREDGQFKVTAFKKHRIFYGVESFLPE